MISTHMRYITSEAIRAMKVEIPDSVAEHCPRTVAWLSNPEATGTEPGATFIEHVLRDFNHLLVGAVDKDLLTGARSRWQLRDDVSEALDSMRPAPDPVFRTRYLCMDFHSFWKSQMDEHGLLAGDNAICDVSTRLHIWYPDARVYRYENTEFVVEVGDQRYVDPELPLGCEPRVAVVEVRANFSIDRACRRILLKVEQGMLEASPGGTEINCDLT